jgi:predicted heme/steroid binding protein
MKKLLLVPAIIALFFASPSRGMAKCGQDLTEVIKQSPHGKAVLSELEQVGQLQN